MQFDKIGKNITTATTNLKVKLYDYDMANISCVKPCHFSFENLVYGAVELIFFKLDLDICEEVSTVTEFDNNETFRLFSLEF